jgi:hypothetical protein
MRVRKNQLRPWDWRQAFEYARGPELTHATRNAEQHTADSAPLAAQGLRRTGWIANHSGMAESAHFLIFL